MSDKILLHLIRPEFRLNSESFIEHLLRILAEEKNPLIFYFESHIKLVYTTMVLDVDRRGGTLLLDALHPEIGNDHLDPEAPVTFSGKARGIETGFRSRIIGKSKEGSQGTVLLTFPFEGYHLQRRAFLRVPFPPETPPITMKKRNGAEQEVRLIDIGGGGIRVLYPEKTEMGEPNDLFSPGDLVMIGRIEIPGLSLPVVVGRIVHLEHSGSDSGQDLQAAGIAFVDFPADCQESILSYVSRRDRELLKTYRSTRG